MLTPARNAKGPAAEAKPDPSPKEIAHQHNLPLILPAECHHCPDRAPEADKWARDLERRVGRAARDTAYYVVCPDYVRVLADELRRGGDVA